MVFRPDLSWEFKSADEIEARSIRAVRNHVKHLLESSPWYKNVLHGFDPHDLKQIDDIHKLPFTTKDQLSDNLDHFRAAEPELEVETVVTSGSTGRPLLFRLTKNDLERLAYNEALSFHAAGVTARDRAQVIVSLDRMFIAGMAYYRGLTTLGANTMRVGVQSFETQKHFLEMHKPTVIVGVPSFLKKLALKLADLGYDTRESSIERIVCIGESLRNEKMELNGVGRMLEESFGARVFSTYGTTELSVAFCECEHQSGGHAHPELVYTEIVDDAGNPVPDGEVGEVVCTPLGVEGMPLLRYRTGDISFRVPDECSCGRHSMRLGPILARKSQMIKARGTTVYPSTITSALNELDVVTDYMIIIEGDDSLSDQVAIYVAAHPSHLARIGDHLRAVARVNFPVLVSNQATINGYRGDATKKIHILDKRVKRR